MSEQSSELLPLNQSTDGDPGAQRGIGEGKGSAAHDHEVKQNLPTREDEIKIAIDRANKIGLTKEQLERYAKDPYWIRIRLALVAAFWIVWIIMFVAAIAIVVLSPKCPAKPPRLWWQKRLCYQIWTPGFADSNSDGVGDLKGIKSKLSELSRIGIQTIRPSGILESAGVADEDITSHVKIDPRVGTLQDFDDLVQATHNRGMYVVIDLPVVTSTGHPWFTKYRESITGYSGFYDIASQSRKSIKSPAGELLTISQGNKSYVPTKRSDKVALLNLEDDGVQKELADAVRFWLDHGVDGFFLIGASLIQELLHNDKLFSKLRIAAYEKKEAVALFSTVHDTERELELRDMLVGEHGLDSVSFERLTYVDYTCNGECFYNILNGEYKHDNSTKEVWPAWQTSDFHSGSLAFRMRNRSLAEAVLLSFMMLPGSLDVMYGEELGTTAAELQLMCWNGQEHGGFSQYNGTVEASMSPECPAQSFEAQLKADASYLKTFSQLSKLRDRAEAFLYGTMRLSVSKEGCLVIWRDSITRTPHFVGLINMKKDKCSVTLEDEAALRNATEISVNAMTSNLLSRGQFKMRQAISTESQKTLELQSYEAIILKYM